MTQQKKQWSAIIIMIALFAMIAFVTNLCSPMAIIVIKSRDASMVSFPSSGKMRKLPARDFRTTCSPAFAKFRYLV